MATNGAQSMIDSSRFLNGHTLSFGDQSYLKMLFEAVCDTSRPLTIVVGAGVSMNSSLPSWSKLISNMAAAIDNEPLSRMAQEDRSEPMRKAEIVLHLAKIHNRTAEEHEFIRNALYQKTQVTPGQLAISLARLAYTRREGVRLLTTNFDVVLEEALIQYFDPTDVQGFAFKGISRWRSWGEEGHVGILHLHGLVRQGEPPEGPLILTESQFLEYGSKVRTFLADILDVSCTLFVGLSMADPNLVGPLYESRSKQDTPRFALVVPEDPPGARNSREAVQYSIEAAQYLDKKLGLKPIFLKSYSQLNQVISDLALAVSEPDKYNKRSTEITDSLAYGKRLARALDSCYSSIGCEKNEHVPIGSSAEKLSTKLHEALLMADGPVDTLQKLHGFYGGPRLGVAGGENLALFLWLRTRELPNSVATYTLTLVGSSAYTHREAWSIRREVSISHDAGFEAALAVFEGTPKAANLQPASSSPIWRGIVATPIIRSGTCSTRMIKDFPADILTIGAITLNSTHKVRPEVPSEGQTTDDSAFSIVSRLDSEDFNELVKSLQRAAMHALPPLPPE